MSQGSDVQGQIRGVIDSSDIKTTITLRTVTTTVGDSAGYSADTESTSDATRLRFLVWSRWVTW